MPSVPSSMDDRCECGHTRFRHPEDRCVAICNCERYRAVKVVDVPLPADRPCDCGHQVRHLESECAAPTPPYTGGRTPEQQALLDAPVSTEPSEPPTCGYLEHPFWPFLGSGDERGKPHCATCGHSWGNCNWHRVKEPCQHERKRYAGSLTGPAEPKLVFFHCPDCKERITVTEEPAEAPQEEHVCGNCDGVDPATCLFNRAEPPMTPEEEEEAPEDTDACDHACTCGHQQHDHSTSGWCNGCGVQCHHDDGHYPGDCWERTPAPCTKHPGAPVIGGMCGGCTQYPADMRPPQPERRPPYAVAYSAAGNLYEVMLPGDATAHAVDGSLVIEHPGSPVLGIVRVLPVPTREAS